MHLEAIFTKEASENEDTPEFYRHVKKVDMTLTTNIHLEAHMPNALQLLHSILVHK